MYIHNSILNISLWSFSSLLLFHSSFSLACLSVVWYFLISGLILLAAHIFLYFLSKRDVLLSYHPPCKLCSRASYLSHPINVPYGLRLNPFFWRLNVLKIFSWLIYSILHHRTYIFLFPLLYFFTGNSFLTKNVSITSIISLAPYLALFLLISLS